MCVGELQQSGRSENCFEDSLGRTVVSVKRPIHISGSTRYTESLSVHKNSVADTLF